MNYDDIVVNFVKQCNKEIGLGENVNFKILSVRDRVLSTVMLVLFFNDSENKHLYIKAYEKQEAIMWSGDLEKEFSILEALASDTVYGLADSVPIPLAKLKDNSAFLMSEVQGHSTAQLLNRATFIPNVLSNVREMNDVMFGTGSWLTRYHNLSTPLNLTFDFSTSVEWVEDRLVKLKNEGAVEISQEFHHNLLGKLNTIRTDIETKLFMTAKLHGDFCPHNIITKSNYGISVIDFAMSTKGPILFDILRFWNELDQIGIDPLHSGFRVKQLKKCFLAGYDIPIDFKSPAVRLILCQFKIGKLLGYFRAKPSLNSKWMYSKNLAWIKREILNY